MDFNHQFDVNQFTPGEGGVLRPREGFGDVFRPTILWRVQHLRKGVVLWEDEGPNLVVDEGINWILSNDLAAATVYVGLTTGSPTPAAGWGMTDAAGIEAAGYDEATRPVWGATLTAKVLANSSPVVFTMDGTDTTVGGGFLCIGNNTKDNGASGTLLALKAFTSGNRTGIVDGDVLNATITLTGSSSS
jgi:hypothetical protein